MSELETYMLDLGRRARAAARALREAPAEARTRALETLARGLALLIPAALLAGTQVHCVGRATAEEARAGGAFLGHRRRGIDADHRQPGRAEGRGGSGRGRPGAAPGRCRAACA